MTVLENGRMTWTESRTGLVTRRRCLKIWVRMKRRRSGVPCGQDWTRERTGQSPAKEGTTLGNYDR
jgi:hypothetical protein